MEQPDTNADIWKSGQITAAWAAEAATRQRNHGPAWELMARLLPFGEGDAFTFADLGAGTGAASRGVLEAYPRATGILADFSAEMISAGTEQLAAFAGRFGYVEFDLGAGPWPAAIPENLDAVITSLSVHHLPDERKQALFAGIFGRLAPGGWYLNYDPVFPADPDVAAAWERARDKADPQAAHRSHHRTAEEQARHENHVRYMIPLDQQLGYLRAAGFAGIDVYYKRLENVIYGGYRPRP